jgi:methyl-accepting chemotaxis protein
MKNLKLSTKLYLVGGLLVAVAITVGIIGIIGIRKTNAGLETVYNDRVVPLKQLKAIADDYAVFIIDAANKANAGIFTAEETLQSLNAANTRIHENWKAYLATTLTTEELVLAKQAEQLYVPADAAVEHFRKFLTGKTGSLKGLAGEFDGPLYQHIDPISGKITELVDLQLRVAKEEYLAAQSRFHFVLWLSIGALVAGVALGGGFGFVLTRATAQTIQSVTEHLVEGAAQTNLAAQEVSSASTILAEGASEQAASLEETSASLEEIASMTKRNAENATSGASLGKQARESAAAGLERINELSRTLNSIKTAVGEMQTAVTEMQSSSQQVSKIIKTIDEIAFQTNLLALNAAVEAARAGEAGMGFAVVADEVRALAQRSAQAAKDTTTRIEDAVKRSELGGVASTKVVKSLTEVEATAQSIQQVFTGIVTQIKSLDEVLAEIAAASKEQSQGVGEVNMAVSQMDKVTQSNAAAAEENAASSQELSTQAQNLKAVIVQLEQIVTGVRADRGQALTQVAPRQNQRPNSRFMKQPMLPIKKAGTQVKSAALPDDRDIPMPELPGKTDLAGAFKDF